jgi:hypothetical protein
MELHLDMVEAWLTAEQSPEALVAEGPSRAAVRALLQELGDGD